MIKHDIDCNIEDFVQAKIDQSIIFNIFGVVTQTRYENKFGLIITILVLDTFELSGEYLYTTFDFIFGKMYIKKINNKDLIYQLKIKYKFYLLNNS